MVDLAISAAPGPPADGAPLEARSVPAAILSRAAAQEAAEPGREYLRHHRGGAWRSISWGDFAERALRVAEGLVEAGLQPGDAVALLSENRVEWLVCDLGIQAAGCVTVPIYPTTTPRTVRHIVADSGARLVIASTRELAKKLDPAGAVPVALIDDRVAAWQAAGGGGNRAEVERRVAALTPADRASIVYTSGTTGEPKGAILLHRNFLAAAAGGLQVFRLDSADTLLSFLPFSHVLERVDGVFIPTVAGCRIVLARGIDTLLDDIQAARPTAMLGVPRVFDKVFEGVHDQAARQPAYRRALFGWALDAGVRRLDPGAGPVTRLRGALADRLVLGSLRRRLTGGRLRFFISGGAPLNQRVEEFFWALGVRILQGWGLTETTSGATTNSETDHRYRTVGRALPGVELRIAADGEIQVRGGITTAGYLNRPEATRELLDAEGWLSTGDIGFLDGDGYLSITDRKKDLIKTAGGKYLAPLPIEARLEANRLIKAALVVGDGHPYAVALVVPDWPAVAAHLGVDGDPAALRLDPRVRAAIQALVDECNRDLAGFETIKRFALLLHDFSEQADELTPTLKPKRRVIAAHYAEEIDALYAAPRG